MTLFEPVGTSRNFSVASATSERFVLAVSYVVFPSSMAPTWTRLGQTAGLRRVPEFRRRLLKGPREAFRPFGELLSLESSDPAHRITRSRAPSDLLRAIIIIVLIVIIVCIPSGRLFPRALCTIVVYNYIQTEQK